MTSVGWLIAAVTAGAAVLLINAGVAKLTTPGPLRRAMAELLPIRRVQVSGEMVRAFGAAETAVALGLLIVPARFVAAIAAAALGLCFMVAGGIGVARRTTVPCGCFGAATRHPLGWVSIALGATLCIPWPAVATAGPLPGANFSAAAALLTSIGAILLSLAQNRHLIKIPHRSSRPVLSEVR